MRLRMILLLALAVITARQVALTGTLHMNNAALAWLAFFQRSLTAGHEQIWGLTDPLNLQLATEQNDFLVRLQTEAGLVSICCPRFATSGRLLAARELVIGNIPAAEARLRDLLVVAPHDPF